MGKVRCRTKSCQIWNTEKEGSIGAYLSNENEEDEEEAKIGAVNTKHGFEWDLVGSMALVFPCRPEADVG